MRFASHRQQPWPPEQEATIERLAFLAAKPELVRRSHSRWGILGRILEAGGASTPGTRFVVGPGTDRRLTGSGSSEKMAALVVACDAVAGRLSTAESRQLRDSGMLPDWFIPAVLLEAKNLQ